MIAEHGTSMIVATNSPPRLLTMEITIAASIMLMKRRDHVSAISTGTVTIESNA